MTLGPKKWATPPNLKPINYMEPWNHYVPSNWWVKWVSQSAKIVIVAMLTNLDGSTCIWIGFHSGFWIYTQNSHILSTTFNIGVFLFVTLKMGLLKCNIWMQFYTSYGLKFSGDSESAIRISIFGLYHLLLPNHCSTTIAQVELSVTNVPSDIYVNYHDQWLAYMHI